jgi:GWxTD domain-containing protein
MVTRSFAALLLSLLAIHTAPAQPQRPPDEQQGQFVFLDAVTCPDTLAAQARIDIRYRIDAGFFIAVRTADTATVKPFLRTGEILIELFDSTNTSASRKIDRVSIPDALAERDPSDAVWYEGMASFRVPHGTYSIFFEASDGQSDRRYVHQAPGTMVKTIPVAPQKLTLFPIGTIAPVADLVKAKIVPDNFGGDILFSATRQMLIGLALPDDTTHTAVVDYRISLLEREGQPGPPLVADSACVVHIVKGYGLQPSEEPGPVSYTLVPRSGQRIGFIAVALKTAQLPLRTYSLSLHAKAGNTEGQMTKTFRNVWPSMPRSLKNVDVAIDALKLIATEQTLDSLTSGDFTQRRDALERFWAMRDPKPGTIANEAMTEFYRRVDHARMAFTTLQEPDGLRSDRGRIYVLNGQPSRVDRALSPQGYTETWTYDKTRRAFTFIDERRNGNYRLAGSPK